LTEATHDRPVVGLGLGGIDRRRPTQTHEPGPNAPPVNAGDPAFMPPPSFDQRGTGFARVIGGRIDIGAVERDPVPVELQELGVE